MAEIGEVGERLCESLPANDAQLERNDERREREDTGDKGDISILDTKSEKRKGNWGRRKRIYTLNSVVTGRLIAK